MGTNFYWKTVPEEFEQYRDTVSKNVNCFDERDSVLIHIGKRSAAGPYCYDCGTTLCKDGTDCIHAVGDKKDWYDVCPICGREGTNACTFRWTILKHKWLVEKLCIDNVKDKLIVDEYGDEYTPLEFLQEANVPVEYQTCQEFV